MTSSLMTDLAVERDTNSIIMVVGVGGAGGNALNHMWNLGGILGVDFMVCNTDKQALGKSPVELKVLLGEDGLGAGNDPERGREAAIISEQEIRRQFEIHGTRMLFVTAGMGGGTGTGASPVIAKIAHEMGILTVAIVTTPDPVEGSQRYQQAFKGVDALKQHVDSLLVINNEHIAEIYGELSLKQAFGKADDILASAAKGIAEIITVESDLVNVDFADVQRVMTDSGRAHMGVASAEGANRAEVAAREALNSPLLGHRSIMGAKHILVNISVANTEDLKQSEVKKILSFLQQEAAWEDADGYHDANIIWGTSEKRQLGEALELVVVVTGFAESEAPTTPVVIKEPFRNKTEEESPLQPFGEKKSRQPLQPMTPHYDDPVVLGKEENPYANIDQLLQSPAYTRRHTEFVAPQEKNDRKKEVLKEEETESPLQSEQSSLF